MIRLPRFPVLALAVLCGAAGCAQFPELDVARADVDGVAYPALVPIETLLNGPAPITTPEVLASTQARAENLRVRAAGLQRQGRVSQRDVSGRLARLRARAAALRAQ